ncbi:leucyl aminopeptidase, partial [Candidatus Uhrbacteria bacterium]|nr:leucyl aminopeptidase [Candidatus Uhrbacteria bacterium]
MEIIAQKMGQTIPAGEAVIGFVVLDKSIFAVLSAFADAKTAETLVRAVKDEGYQGKENQTLLLPTLGRLPTRRVLLVGLGEAREINLERLRRAAAAIARQASEHRITSATTFLPIVRGITPRRAAKAMTEGLLLGDYRFEKFKEQKKSRKESRLKTLIFQGTGGGWMAQVERGIAEGRLAAEAVIAARDLVNEPAMHMTPARLITHAECLVKDSKGKIKLKVFDKVGLKAMGAGGILGVAMGSDHPPYLAHLIWKPAGAKRKIALVGKAITFDSGGLSLKPSEGMMTMKCDMAGAAVVLGVFSALTKLQPKVEVHGIFAACENMPSGKAIRPGDVVATMGGKTIEILNTDAEGRVTLADSLHYATRLKPDIIIDLATLTGACVVALGEDIAGLMSTNEWLEDKLEDASQRAGESFWRLPLPSSYREHIVSRVADVKNIGHKWGGALTAGLFLKEFVGSIPWA